MDDIDYQALFMALPSPKMVIRADDPHFTIIAENEAHAHLIRTDGSLSSVGKPFLQAYPDTSEEFKKTGRNTVIESMRRVVKNGFPDSMPDIRYDISDAEGVYRVRWWRATHFPIKDKSGTVIQVLQITQDITDELKATRQLEKTQAQLDLALSVGLVSSYHWNIQKDIVTGDKNLAKMFGVSAESAQKGLPLKRFLDSIYEDDRERVGVAIQQTIDEDAPFETEYRTYKADGSIAWVIARGSIQRDEKGNARYFVGILIDITDRKDAEIELQGIKRMFDALFESAILCVALADTDGNVLQANKTFLRTFGYTKKELQAGINSRDLTPIASREVTIEIYEAIKEKGESAPVEKQYQRKDGTLFTGLIGAARIPESDNQFMAFILDVSENKRLKEINAAKDDFIALASHQLRTPATAVKQYLGIILEGYAGDVEVEQRHYLQTAYDSNERELTIINDLLKTAQLDTHGFALQPKQIDVVSLIDDIIQAIRPVCDVKHQTIEFTHDTTLRAHIDVDETRVVLANLIENAHKYSREGTTIFVEARRVGEFARITVRDEGVGIKESDIEAVFEKFKRVQNPLSDVSDGNGLGLYWVKRIVTLHGGRLDVTSEIGKGTTFMVELPL